MKVRGILTTAVVLAGLGVGGFWLFSVHGKPATSGLQFGQVERGDLELTVSSTGTLSAVGTVEVGAQVSADLKKIHVDYNDRVTKGQVLAEFDSALLRAELTKAQAEVLRRQAALDRAEAEYARNKPLFEKDYLSEAEFLAFDLDRKTARAELKTAQASLDIAKINLRYAVIRSPVDGTVIERSVEEGQTLVARMETPKLFVIAEDLSKMQIEVAVDESDIGQIREGMQARFTVQAYLDDTFTGQVRQIRLQPETVQNVVNYTVIVDAANQGGRLLPGMTATVDFIVASREDVLLVPNKATRFRPPPAVARELMDLPPEGRRGPGPGRSRPGARVFVASGEGRIRPVPFTKGISDGKMTEVVGAEAIEAGTRVVVAYDGDAAKKSNDGDRPAGLRRGGMGMGRGPGPGGPPPF